MLDLLRRLRVGSSDLEHIGGFSDVRGRGETHEGRPRAAAAMEPRGPRRARPEQLGRHAVSDPGATGLGSWQVGRILQAGRSLRTLFASKRPRDQQSGQFEAGLPIQSPCGSSGLEGRSRIGSETSSMMSESSQVVNLRSCLVKAGSEPKPKRKSQTWGELPKLNTVSSTGLQEAASVPLEIRRSNETIPSGLGTPRKLPRGKFSERPSPNADRTHGMCHDSPQAPGAQGVVETPRGERRGSPRHSRGDSSSRELTKFPSSIRMAQEIAEVAGQKAWDLPTEWDGPVSSDEDDDEPPSLEPNPCYKLWSLKVNIAQDEVALYCNSPISSEESDYKSSGLRDGAGIDIQVPPRRSEGSKRSTPTRALMSNPQSQTSGSLPPQNLGEGRRSFYATSEATSYYAFFSQSSDGSCGTKRGAGPQTMIPPSAASVEASFGRHAKGFGRGLLWSGEIEAALEHLGFPPFQTIQWRSVASPNDEAVDLERFGELVLERARELEVLICSEFDRFDVDLRGKIYFHEVHWLLSSLGFEMCSQEGTEVCRAAGLEYDADKAVTIMEVFLVVRHVQESCRALPMCHQAMATAAFRKFAKHEPDVEELRLRPEDLKPALVEFFGGDAGFTPDPAFQIDVSEIIEKCGGGEKSQGALSLEAFLDWARRAWRLETTALLDKFATRFDVHGDGFLDHDDAAAVMTALGYIPLKQVVRKFMPRHEMGPLEFVAFVFLVRRHLGFTQRECQFYRCVVKHLVAVRLDAANAFSVLRLIRVMGYKPHVEDIYEVVEKMGKSFSSPLTEQEVLAIMRAHRERTLLRCLAAFNKLVDGKSKSGRKRQPRVHCACLAPTLHSLSQYAGDAFSHAAESIGNNNESVDFDGMVAYLDVYGLLKGLELKEKVRFTDQEADVIWDVFQQAMDKDEFVALESVPGLLEQFEVPCYTDERSVALEAGMQVARQVMADKGCPEGKGNTLNFLAFLRLLRSVADFHEDFHLSREVAAMKEHGISPIEVRNYRRVFESTSRPRQAEGLNISIGLRHRRSEPQAPSPSRGVSPSSGDRPQLLSTSECEGHMGEGLYLEPPDILRDYFSPARMPLTAGTGSVGTPPCSLDEPGMDFADFLVSQTADRKA